MIEPARRAKVLLVASLVLNVFLIGAMAGAAYRWSTLHSTSVAAAAHPRGLRAAASELPESRRLQLRQALQQTRRANRPVILDAQAGRRAIVDALRSQPFDPLALDSALARTRAADATLRTRLEQTIGQFAADLDSAERAKLVDAMEQGGRLRSGGAPNR